MNLAVKAYTAFKEDEKKALVLSEIFEAIEDRFSNQAKAVTSDELKESHLQLKLEIERNRHDFLVEIEKNRTESAKIKSDLQLDIAKVRSDLQLDIAKVRSDLQIDIEKVRSDLQIDIENVRSNLQLEIEKNRTAIEQTKTELARLMNRQVIWIIGSISFVIGMLKALDYILK